MPTLGTSANASDGDAINMFQLCEEQKFRIYLVGFPTGITDKGLMAIADMIPHLVPEAKVYQHSIFRKGPDLRAPDQVLEEDGKDGQDDVDTAAARDGEMSDSATPASGSYNATPFSSAWIENEAMILLNRIRKHKQNMEYGIGGAVLLAGYGFGGIVVKQAVVFANTMPRFYSIAITISSLCFFNTPHGDIKHLLPTNSSDSKQPKPPVTRDAAWEEKLFDMVKSTNIEYEERLSDLLSGLVDCVVRHSLVFYQFAAKYNTFDFVDESEKEPEETENTPEEQKPEESREKRKMPSEYCNNISVFKCTIYWPSQDAMGLAKCAKNVPEELWMLREHFAPPRLLARQIQAQKKGDISFLSGIDDLYLTTLQALSPSRRILYDKRTLDALDEDSHLRQVYKDILQKLAWKDVQGKSIQIIGPAAQGKSPLVKLISQTYRTERPIVVVDYLPRSVEQHRRNLYGVIVSTLHQILSQRPSLFAPIRSTMDVVRTRHAWSEETLSALLSSVLRHAGRIDVLVVVYDFDRWPAVVQDWWRELRRIISQPVNATCTFITSSVFQVNMGADVEIQPFDISDTESQYRNAWIETKTQQLLSHYVKHGIISHHLAKHIESDIYKAAQNFVGPPFAVGEYIIYLLQALGISSALSMGAVIDQSPKDEAELCKTRMELVKIRNPVTTVDWAHAVLSWVLLAFRELRVKELAVAAAVAVAVQAGNSEMGKKDVEDGISVDMENDLRSVLGGIVVVENKYTRILSSVMRKLLRKRDSTCFGFKMASHKTLTVYCLKYLQVALRDCSWASCVALASPQYKTDSASSEHREPTLGFLDYACRFWPLHFRAAICEHKGNHGDVDKDLEELVRGFFASTDVARRWLQLYLIFTGHSAVQDEPILYEPSPSLDIILHTLLDCRQLQNFEKCARYGCIENDIGRWDDMLLSNPVYCAIAENNSDMIQKLQGADGMNWQTDVSPLSHAVLVGRDETIRQVAAMVGSQHISHLDATGSTALHLVAACNRKDALKVLLDTNESETTSEQRSAIMHDINVRDSHGKTALMVAVCSSSVDVAKILIRNTHVSVNINDNDDMTVLHYAVLYCQGVFDALLEKCPTLLFTKDKDGHLPLHLAAQKGNHEMVRCILKNSEAQDRLHEVRTATDVSGYTALHYACENGFVSVAQELYWKDMDHKIFLTAMAKAVMHGHLYLLHNWNAANFDVRDDDFLLATAARCGQLAIVLYLLQNGASANGETYHPLFLATTEGHVQVIRTLLHYGADINLEDDHRRTALHLAAMNGKIQVAKMLLEYRADDTEKGTKGVVNVDACDADRYTPLHLAALQGDEEMVKLLLDHHASIDAVSSMRQTVLHVAAQHSNVLDILFEKRTDLDANIVDQFQQTPLHIVASTKHVSSAITLLGHGADADRMDDGRKSPMTIAIGKDNTDMVRVFLEKQDRNNGEVWTPYINTAMDNSALKVLKLLLEYKTDTDDTSNSLLCRACRTNSVDVLRFLLDERHENIEGCDRLGWTPLIVAAFNGCIENLQELIDRKADVTACDDEKRTALHWAADQGQEECVSALLKAGAPVDPAAQNGETPLFLAVYNSQQAIVELLLNKEVNMNIRRSDGWSLLHAATDNAKITKLILDYDVERGVQVNYQRQSDGYTALHFTVRWGAADVAAVLLEYGADPNLQATTKPHPTPFHLAILKGEEDVMKTMLDRQGSNAVDPNKPTSNNECPLDLAIRESISKNIVKCLIHKEDINLENRPGEEESYLELAISCGRKDILELLLKDKSWNEKAIVGAYWRAIESMKRESLSVLLDNNHSLVDYENEKGQNWLVAYFACEAEERGRLIDASFVSFLLDCGISPWKRSRPDCKNGFEFGFGLGFKGRYKPTNECVNLNAIFAKNCIETLPIDLKEIGLGFRDLRIATEMDESVLWEKLHPALLSPALQKEIDADGWNIHHFVYQASPRITLKGLRDSPALYEQSTKLPSAMVTRPLWMRHLCSPDDSVQISTDGLTVTFTDKDFVTVRSNHPLAPRTADLVYFEVTLAPLPDLKDGNLTDSEFVFSIGLVCEYTDMMGAHLGWNPSTVGLHSDDGCVYEDTGFTSKDIGVETPYKSGNKVGCGIDYQQEKCFFTLNGEVVFRWTSKIIYRKLFPAIAHENGNSSVEFNFGRKPFAYKLANLEKQAPERPQPIRHTSTSRMFDERTEKMLGT